MLFRRNMISTKLGNMECAKPTNTAAPPVQLRSPQYAANLRRLKRGGLLLCSSRPPNWSQHNFEYYGQQLRPSHPLIEGRLIVFDEMGLEICSSVLGQTRPTTLYMHYEYMHQGNIHASQIDIMDTCIMDIYILDTCIMDTIIMDTSIMMHASRIHASWIH